MPFFDQFLIFLVLFLIFAPTIFLFWYNSAKQKGKRGEKRVLSILMQLSDDYTIMNDLVFKTDKGTTQIDHVVISKYGVFAIETKNYRGDIYGDDKRQNWTQLIVTNVNYRRKLWKTYTYVTKNNLYNPVKQSLGHVYEIKKLLAGYSYLKIVPIVVFVGNANLDNVVSRHHVVYKEQLLSVINEYKAIYLTDDEVQDVIRILEENNLRGEVSNREHIKNIRNERKEIDKTISSGVCPKCGGQLIKRKGVYGSFYGCSNYPKCRFTTQ